MMHNKDLNLLELFSGAGGFLQGFLKAGFTFNNVFFSEIDKHAIANYKYNFKKATYAGSVKHIRGNQLPRIDIITFGSPCQDFSIAGNRAGLDGEKSSLIGEAIRLISEKRPSIFVWENVKGAFSSNEGRDFQAILREFTNLGGYRLEWQLLNTDWVLPQNRERIYLIGHLTGASFPGVFPISKNDRLFRNKIQRQPQAENCQCLKGNDNLKKDDTYISVPKKAGCLSGGGNSGGLNSDMTTIETGVLRTFSKGTDFRKIQSDLSPSLSARVRKDGNNQPVIKIQPVLTIDRKIKRQNGRRFKEAGEPSFTLNCQDHHGIMITQTKELENGDSLNLKALKSKTRRGEVGKGKTHTLDTDPQQAVYQNKQIRRLTNIEWERLQGFPDDWTKKGLFLPKWIENYLRKRKRFTHPDLFQKMYESALIKFQSNQEKEIPNTQRYKLMGNAVTTDIVEIVALKIKDCLIQINTPL
ncbi:DNA (cytosine-5-)-methyltransferase [Cochleicola gelatinilyticus]|uniref:Cytosine-specific methyltransferase n=1 Tax=Cochleicola gelatinilyticus TaxID=1763537 RepID=A0A167IK66_9FLAO|nr:DNA (cytosine-5-)-methyltransferase [Cochleicola gelatinilyticus]OAB79737.1 hypothetical protein ULVI_03050 [Cochleicola gelatinilyticus]